METHPAEGVLKERFPNTRKPSHQQVCGEFWNLRRQHNQEETNKQTNKKSIDYTANCNSQWRCSPDAHVCHQCVGAEQGGGGYILKVRTGPECSEDNLRELT